MTDDEKLTELEGRLRTKIDAVKQDIADDMFVAETTGEPVNLWDYCVELSPDEAEQLLTELHTLRQRNARLVEGLEEIAESIDAGRHDGLPEECPAHDADTMWALARTLIEDNSNG